MYATDYMETMICNLLRGQSITSFSSVYLGLFLSDPGDAGTGSEAVYSGYARQTINFSAPAASGQGLVIQNTSAITFAEAGASIGSVTHVGVLDSLTGGNMLLYGQLDTALPITSGVTPVIRANAIKWIFSGALSTYYRTAIMNLFRGSGNNVSGFIPYIAFFNGDPNASGVEFSGNNYSRTAVTFTTASAQPSGSMQVENTAEVLSGISTGNWGSLTHVAIADALSGGNIFGSVSLGQAYAMTTGKSAGFHAGDLKFNIN